MGHTCFDVNIFNMKLRTFTPVSICNSVLFLGYSRYFKNNIYKCKKEQPRQHKRKVGPQQIMKIQTNLSTTVQRWKLIIKIFPNCVVHSIITSNWGRLTKQTLKGNIIIFLRRLTAVLNKYSNFIVFHTQKYVKCNNHNV